MIDPRQIRAARALLNWSQDDLAKASGIARSSIKNIENDITVARKDTVYDIQTAFENSGIEFLPSSGVRIKNEIIHVIEGEHANEYLLNDIYNTLQNSKNAEVLICGLEERLALDNMGEEDLNKHIKRLTDAGIKEKILLKRGDTDFINSVDSYRWIDEQYFFSTPVQIYGNKIALIVFQPVNKIILIESEQFSEAFKKLFHFVWDRAEIAKK
jgi:transcriptional regulator with XRE-family HTH domain